MRPFVLVLFLGGCGRDYCERLADETAECSGGEASEADLEKCREMLEPCGGDDQEALEDSLDCSIDAGLYTCEEPDNSDPTGIGTTTGTTEDFTDLVTCFLPLAGISPECAASVGVVGFTNPEVD